MNEPKLSLRGHAYAWLCIVMWASSFIFTRIAGKTLSPMSLMTLRFVIASLTALAACALLRVPVPRLRDIPLFLLAGGLGFFLYMTCFHLGMLTVDSATGSLIIAIVPICTALLARPLYGERISPLGWGGILAAFGGILLLTLWEGGLSGGAGIWLLLGSALTSALYSLVQRRILRSYSPLAATSYALVAGTVMMLGFLPAALRELPGALTANPAALAVVVYLGVFPAMLAYLFWSKALALAPHTNDVTNYLFINPILAAAMGFVIGGEVPSAAVLVSGAVTVAGLLLFGYAKTREHTPAAPEETQQEETTV